MLKTLNLRVVITKIAFSLLLFCSPYDVVGVHCVIGNAYIFAYAGDCI